MQRSKTFVKKTRKGGIVKIVREHYLRDDIWCGSEGCNQCENETPTLSSKPDMPSTLCDFPHYLILDTNVVLHQVFIYYTQTKFAVEFVNFFNVYSNITSNPSKFA